MAKELRPRVVLVNRCFITNNQGEILFIRRAPSEGHYSSLWEVPGGKLDEGQDLSHALEREVLEETGLLIEPGPRLFCTDSRVLGAGKYKGLPYVALFFSAQSIGGQLVLSNEHTDHTWLPYKKALELDLTPEVRKALIIFNKG